MLRNAPNQDVRLIVVTDNERILGLGDQGAGGMGIPIGKLALYTAAAGIHPALCLPISLDVGTDNVELLADPYYLGYRQRRLRGAEVRGVHRGLRRRRARGLPARAAAVGRLPQEHRAACSWIATASGSPASTTTSRAPRRSRSAGILSALRITGGKLAEQRIVYLGAGAAGVGIARLVKAGMVKEGADADTIRRAQAMLDSQGLVFNRTRRPRSLQARVLLEPRRPGPLRLRRRRAVRPARRRPRTSSRRC